MIGMAVLPSSVFIGNDVGPNACSMDNTQDPHDFAFDTIRRDIGRAGDNEFARFLHSSRTPAIWKIDQAPCRRSDPLVHHRSRVDIVRFNVSENRTPILQRPLRPDQLHDLLDVLMDCGATSGELGLNILVGNVRARILKCLAHLGAKPCIIGFLIRH